MGVAGGELGSDPSSAAFAARRGRRGDTISSGSTVNLSGRFNLQICLEPRISATFGLGKKELVIGETRLK
jgi:hypothetical protein